MGDSNSFSLVIVSPDTLLYEGTVSKLIAPGHNMEIAILPNHTPLYAQLKEGSIIITETSGVEKTINIDGGILRVKRNSASVIVGFEALRQ